ncbi:MAG: GNAT family N-acetyltransferase [Caldilineales bacterium]|nr:GNAT family N-acetyltransferase [Caldilineales bacterium]
MAGDADFWRMRELLIATASVTPIGFNWDVRRLDGKRFYSADPADNRLQRRPIQLWETGEGQLVGYLLAEGADDAHLQVHPDYRHLEAEMIGWAVENLSVSSETGQRQLEIYVMEYDALRQRLLAERGFEKMNYGGMIRRLRLGEQPLDESTLAAGYTLRTTNPEDISDCQRIADLLNAAFRRDFHNAAEYQNFARLAPSFVPDLDLVAVAPDDSFAAYVAIPYDEGNRRGIFEPVCTHPDHQRRGLAKALMQEGLLRLRALGAIDVTVDTGDMIPANSLYDSLGFTEAYKGYAWRKT